MIIGHSRCHSYEYVAVECGLMCKKKLRAVPMYISVNFTYNKWSLSLTVYCLDVTDIMCLLIRLLVQFRLLAFIPG